MPRSSRILSQKLPEIHTMEKSDFLKLIIHSQIIKLTVFTVLLKNILKSNKSKPGWVNGLGDK